MKRSELYVNPVSRSHIESIAVYQLFWMLVTKAACSEDYKRLMAKKKKQLHNQISLLIAM